MANSRTIVIEGIKPYGLVIAKRLVNRKEDVVLVDKDEKLCKDTSNSLDVMVLEGEIKEDILSKNSTTEFDVFIAARDNDGDNLISCLYIKNHYKEVDKVMSIVQDEGSEEAFTKSGILTVNPERAAAKILLRYMAGNPKYIEFIASLGMTELSFFEIKPGSRLDGKKILTIPIHDEDYSVVLVYRKTDKIPMKMPGNDFILEAGDVLQLCTRPKYNKKLREYIKG